MLLADSRSKVRDISWCIQDCGSVCFDYWIGAIAFRYFGITIGLVLDLSPHIVYKHLFIQMLLLSQSHSKIQHT